MFTSDRNAYRLAFLDAWQKARGGQPLEPVEHQIIEIINEHPEYQAILAERERALSINYLPERGDVNPFLHMSLHLALRDQVRLDQPKGMRAHYQRLVKARGDAHAAEHRLLECLAEMLWQLQQPGARAFDEAAYMRCIKRVAHGKGVKRRAS